MERIPVRAERPRGYDREAWPHWTDSDSDCQDARQEVLAAESLEAVRWDSGGCAVVSGLWHDSYTGETFRDPRALDVDHLVPLAEAYRSGGRDWDVTRRAAYANDLGDPRTLIAVSASANRSKGDQGPEEWLTPEGDYRCRYIANWVAVKVRWSLSMDERERVTVGNLLRECAEG
ncbi:MAG TPA: HNH endonuclease family protein [Rubellimicrobium sp.]|nr:HNH endonuclease family protein [Rubellimicrobium sp.]